jgi:hypothetical protein
MTAVPTCPKCYSIDWSADEQDLSCLHCGFVLYYYRGKFLTPLQLRRVMNYGWMATVSNGDNPSSGERP